MPPTSDTSEFGLETLIVETLTGKRERSTLAVGVPTVDERVALYDNDVYVLGESRDYDRDHAVDLVQLQRFVSCTQPEAFDALGLAEDSPKRIQFLHRLQGEVAKRGVIDVLRNGVKHGFVSVDLFYGAPTAGNMRAVERKSTIASCSVRGGRQE